MSSVVDGIVLRLGADPASLQAGLRKASASLDTFGGRAGAVMGRINASLKTSADRALTPMTGLLLGGGVAVAASRFGDFSEELMYYGMVAKKSKDGIAALRAEIHGLAKQTGIDQQIILGGINKIAEITGDTKFAEGVAPLLAKTSRATKASMDDLSTVAATMRAQWGWTEEQIGSAMNKLIVQGDAGSYTLQKLAVEGKPLFASANAFGLKSMSQFESFGAMLQIINLGAKSEAEVTTAISSLMNELIAKSKDLGKLGIKVFDKKDGKTQVRDFEAIIMELMAKTKGDISVISPLFGDQAKTALKPLMEEYQRGWTNYRKIRDSALGSGTSEIEARFATTANDFNRNVGMMKAAALEFADVNMAGPIDRLTKAMQFLSEHQGLFSAALYSLAAAAGVLAAVKLGGLVNDVGRFARELKSIGKGKSAESNGMPGSLTSVSGVQQVYVVNWHEMGATQGMTSLADPSRNATQGMRGLGDAATQATGKMAKFRGGLNKIGGSDLGMGLLSMATAMANEKIIEAGTLLYDWYQSKKSAREVNEKAMSEMAPGFESRYGKKAAGWSKVVDNIDLAIQDEETSFFPNQAKIESLYNSRSFYMKKLKDEIASNPNSAAYKAKAQESVVGTISPINNEFKIFVDPAKQTAVVEQVSGPVNGKFVASTKPWTGRVQ